MIIFITKKAAVPFFVVHALHANYTKDLVNAYVHHYLHQIH
jgi:hypothetical protein